MPTSVNRALQSRNFPLLTVVVVTAVLYFARAVLIPLAMAVLLTFLLAPPVRRLERAGLNRIAATAVMVLLTLSVIVATAWVTGRQALELAGSLPQYRENIQEKIDALRAPTSFSKASEAIQDISTDIAEGPQPRTLKKGFDPRHSREPMEVAIRESNSPLEALRAALGPFMAPLGTAAAVLIFTILLLVQREDMRDKLIRLIGRGEINLTTQALADAAQRVSRYLVAQLVVNLCYGVPVGIALYFIGIPNAALFGLLAIVLRFIPYAGVWIAASMPVVLAFAIGDGWSLVVQTALVFVVLELITANFLEPWLYGTSTGLASIAVIAAAIFWTWLWGAIGLLLATPLTVCLAVMGRYIQQLHFLDVLLGDTPVLLPQERYYQRLLAFDQEEATELAEEAAAKDALSGAFDKMLLPALALAETDRHQEALDDKRERFVFDNTQRLIEELGEGTATVPPRIRGGRRPRILIVPIRDQADGLAGLMLEKLALQVGLAVQLLPYQASANEVVDAIAEGKAHTVVISGVPPFAAVPLAYLARRLRRHFPELTIIAGYWSNADDVGRARTRLEGVGVDHLVTTLAEALALMRSDVAGVRHVAAA
jgi:predicted PurR-regulated permease PerM/methylmalonyl-CoA mutase cobalamin-binding subunit